MFQTILSHQRPTFEETFEETFETFETFEETFEEKKILTTIVVSGGTCPEKSQKGDAFLMAFFVPVRKSSFHFRLRQFGGS